MARRSPITAKKVTLLRPSFHKMNLLLGHVECRCGRPAIISVPGLRRETEKTPTAHLYTHFCEWCAEFMGYDITLLLEPEPVKVKKPRTIKTTIKAW